MKSSEAGERGAVSLWEAVIAGEPFSKANSRLNMVRNNRVVSYKAPKAQKYAEAAVSQMAQKRPLRPLEGDLRIDLVLCYSTRRKDMDPSLVLDCLQRAGIVRNDRSFREQHIYWHLDKDNPRAVIRISERKQVEEHFPVEWWSSVVNL